MNVTADGSAGEAWRSRYKEFANAVGLLITVNVADVCRNANVGTRKCVGTTSLGTRILADVNLYIWIQAGPSCLPLLPGFIIYV